MMVPIACDVINVNELYCEVRGLDGEFIVPLMAAVAEMRGNGDGDAGHVGNCIADVETEGVFEKHGSTASQGAYGHFALNNVYEF